MSLLAGIEELNRKTEEIRRIQGDKAADEYYSGVTGAGIGGAGGAATGMAIGTAICPGLGTVVGGLVGWFVGAEKGASDKTTGDNLKRAAGAVISAGLHHTK